MRLIEMNINNFKGIRKMTLSLDGRNASLYGDNATGKTSVFDAFQWLLFGKDSQGRSDFEVKPLGEDGKALQAGLEVSVEAILEHEGRRVVLAKVLSENWVRPRGSREQIFQGHSTQHSVDGVPVRQKEYQAFIDGMIPESRFRLLTNPYYFCQMLPWKERREILFEIAGEVSDAEVLSSSTEFAPLADALADHSVEDMRKILSASLKKVNAELAALPVRIDETTRTMTEEVDTGAARAQAESLQQMKRALEAQLLHPDTALLEAEAVKLGAEISRKKAEMLAEATQARSEWERVQRERMDGLRNKLEAVEGIQDESPALARQILAARKSQDECRSAWIRVNAESPKVETHCPTCRRPYDNQEALQAAIEEFEAAKVRRLEEIQMRGQQLGQEIAELEKQKQENMARAEQVRAEREAIRAQIAAIRAEVFTPPAIDSTVLAGLEQQKAGILAQAAAVKAGVQQENMALYGRIAAMEEAIRAAMADIARQEQNERAKARIAELMEQQEQKAAEMERMEHLRDLTEEFMRVKVQMIQERVDGAFSLAKFRLFDEQVNGGLSDACEVMVEGVPFRDLNHAMQINVGLDVIRTLGRRFGVAAPVVVDNAESVTVLETMPCQLIRLVVSAQDKQLRMVLE